MHSQNQARSNSDRREALPMKHNPLCNGNDTLLRFIQRRELSFDRIIRICHCVKVLGVEGIPKFFVKCSGLEIWDRSYTGPFKVGRLDEGGNGSGYREVCEETWLRSEIYR